MIRVRRWPVAVFAGAAMFLLHGIVRHSVTQAQAVTEENAIPDNSIAILVSSKLLPAEPIQKDERNEHAGIVFSVRFSPDGKTVATGWGDGTIRIWDVATRKNIAAFVSPKVNPDETVLIRSVAFSPDGKTVASANTGTSSSGMIRLWDLATGKNIAAFNGQQNSRVLSGIYCVVYSPDGKKLASGHEDNLIRVWDAASGEIVNTFQAGDDDCGYAVAFSPNGETLASGGADGEIFLWDVTSGENQLIIKAVGSGNSVTSLAYHPDGKTLGAGCWMEGGGMLWDVATGKNIAKFKPDRVYSEIAQNTEDMTYSVAFSPNGQSFAQGCDNGLIVLWDVNSRAITSVLYGHANLVRSIDFSPDGNTLVSGGIDGTVRLYRKWF